MKTNNPFGAREMKRQMEDSIREAINPILFRFAACTGLWPETITLKINVGSDGFTKRVHGDKMVVKVEKVEAPISI